MDLDDLMSESEINKRYLELKEEFQEVLNDRIWCRRNGIKDYANPNIQEAKIKFYEWKSKR